MVLRMGIVGCGDIAQYTAMMGWFIRPLKITACCDSDARRAEAFARRYRIPQVYTNYITMLESQPLEAVYLAVPHHLHAPMTLEAVQRGKAVLMEKPLARSVAEGLDLLAKAGGGKVGVNYQYRYDSACYALAKAIQNGVFGSVHSIRIHLPWRREAAYFDASPWHRSLEHSGGGTLLTQASHFLDWAFWALGEKPLTAMGYTRTIGFDVEVETLAHGLVQTEQGTLVNVVSSMVSARERAVVVEVEAERGSARYIERPLPHVTYQGVKVRKEQPPQRGFHALQRSLAGFVEWVLEDKLYLIPMEEALPALAAVEAIYGSARSGQREFTIYGGEKNG